jgi:hypothetical protein
MGRRLVLLVASCALAQVLSACGNPGGGPGGPAGGPPAEAYTACTGKKSGDACDVKMGDKTESGTCAAAPDGASDARLSCRPAGGPKAP